MVRIPVVMLIGQTGFGGSERQLYYLLKYGDRERFEYHVIVTDRSQGPTYDKKIRALGVKLWRLPRSCERRLQRILYLFRLLRKIDPLVLHSWTFHLNPYAGLVGLMAGVPVLIGSQRGTSRSPAQQRMHPVVRWLCYHTVSRQVVNSDLVIDEMVARGYPREKIHYVFNGVELPDLGALPSPDLSAYGIRSETEIVGTVGNLRENKNQRMFVRGMVALLSRFPDVHGLIVGKTVPDEPDMKRELKSLIDERGASHRIHLTGGRSDVPALMQRMSVFCLTSRSEGLPNVVLEAMAAACPVVATPIGGVPDVIQHNKNGLLVNVDDHTAMTDAVENLLRRPGLRSQLGTEGRKTVASRFGCKRMANTMESVYLDALSSQGLNLLS